MSARRRVIDLDSLLAFIRENGPITKTELVSRVLGYRVSKTMISALHELENKKLITYYYGKTRRGRTAMVYEARAA